MRNSNTKNGPCFVEWTAKFTAWSGNPLTHQDDERKVSEFEAVYKRHYGLPFALRHRKNIDSVMGAYCLISLLARNQHLNRETVPFLSEEASYKIFRALENMDTSLWWTRTWVVQELVLAPQATVYYGRFIAPWDMYVTAARNYDAHLGGCCKDHYKWL